MEIAPRYDELLKANAELPEHLRQVAVVLRFAEPIKESACGEFLRIHLRPEQLAGGEDGFYLAEVYQPDRVRMLACPNCRQPMDRIAETLARCRNPACLQVDGTPTSEFAVVTGPMRGICQVVVFPDWIVEHRPAVDGGRPVAWVKACMLVLDRRYHPQVLAAIVRTAGAIADMNGWRLL